MAPPANPTYMDLPEEIKLQILGKLDNNTELMLCRLVCKGFMPRDLGVVITLFGKKGITVKLNLTPGVESFSSEELDNLDIFHGSSSVSEKNIENLANVPPSILEKTRVLVVLFSDHQNELLKDLDLISKHCSQIKLFFIVMVNNRPEVDEMMERLFLKNSKHFTNLAIFPVATFTDDEKSLTFDCGSLQQCAKLSQCFIIGNWTGGPNTFAEVNNLDKLPNSVQGLGFFKASIQELEWTSENLGNLHVLYLEVDETRTKGTNGEPRLFSQDLFERLVNMPSLTQMELLFNVRVEDSRFVELKGILGGIVDQCRGKAGIQAELQETPAGYDGDDYELTEVAILVTITRPPFRGFNDAEDDDEMEGEWVDVLDMDDEDLD